MTHVLWSSAISIQKLLIRSIKISSTWENKEKGRHRNFSLFWLLKNGRGPNRGSSKSASEAIGFSIFAVVFDDWMWKNQFVVELVKTKSICWSSRYDGCQKKFQFTLLKIKFSILKLFWWQKLIWWIFSPVKKEHKIQINFSSQNFSVQHNCF